MLSLPRVISREMRPFFRLLEDPFFEHHLVPSSASSLLRSSTFNSFTPSFDVKETKDSYILDGELPGVTDKSNLDLQFVDPQTLVIKGRIERSSSRGNENDTEAATTNAIATPISEVLETKSRQPTVEDEAETSAAAETIEQKVTQPSNEKIVSKPENQNRYWVQERTVGQFQRTFSFPQNVDHDAVKASLKNGILSIVVPKKSVAEVARKIQIE